MPHKDLLPPASASRLLKFLANGSDYDCAMGDLVETYEYITETQGIKKANRWFWMEVIKSLPGFLKNRVYRRTAMMRNYFKIAFRNIVRNRLFAVINIFGLAVGMASFINVYVQIPARRGTARHVL